MMFAVGSVGQAGDFDKSQLLKLLGGWGPPEYYYLTFHPLSHSENAAEKITIYVASNRNEDVLLTIPGKNYSKTLTAVAGGVVEFDLTAELACPYTKLPGELPLPEQVFVDYGIRIVSDANIAVYGMIEYANTSEGFLVPPVSDHGKEFIVSSWPDSFGGSEENKYSSYTSIVAAYDKTTVRIEYGGEDWTETAGGKKPGEKSTFNMNEGDVVCIGTVSKHGDLTGTKITSNYPVAVISGSYCAGIPSGSGNCNVLIEAEIPTNAWSLDYHISKISGSSGKSTLRIFARENATQIFKDGKPFGFISKSGGINGEGWLEYRAFETDSIPFVISGDKPISVTQYNQGSDEEGAESGAFQMLMSTRESYLEEYIFPTPGLNGGSGFDNNYLNLVYEVTELGTIPDDLKLGKFEDSVVVWEQINAIDSDPGAEFEYSLKDKRYFSKTIKLPGNGIYRVKAKDPFAGYAYGHSAGKSYGFPLGGGYFDLSIPDTVPPNVEWTIDCLGNVSGTVTDMPDDIEYRSNLSMVYMETQSAYNFDFRYEAFIAGETRSTTFTLKVIDTQQEGRAVIVFSDRRGNDTTITFEYYPTLFSIHEDEYNFGRLAVGESSVQQFWIVNDSKHKEFELSELNLKYGNQGFEITDSPVTAIVPPLDSISFRVKFTATERGSFEDSIGVGDTCVFRYAAHIKANVGAPRIAVGSYDFGCV
ncbi:MAG: IgGFc-binding protein, partial [Chlorobi bacterium]|nr:IgGFc-binding protein [Chlorobiota bacterium]